MARIPTKPSATPVLFTLKAGSRLMRIYDPSQHGTGPVTFRPYGPLLRFDHHPGIGRAMRRKPELHPSRGILYAAYTLDCCVTEVFGSNGVIDLGARRLADIEVTRDLQLVDLVDEAMAAGTIAAISQTEHHYKAQVWSRQLYDLAGCSHIDGIYYRTAHVGDLSFALYERAADGVQCAPGATVDLDDPRLHLPLLNIAKRRGLTL